MRICSYISNNIPILGIYNYECSPGGNVQIAENRNYSAGGAGGRSPLAGARGIPASSLHLPPQVARRGDLNGYRKS